MRPDRCPPGIGWNTGIGIKDLNFKGFISKDLIFKDLNLKNLNFKDLN